MIVDMGKAIADKDVREYIQNVKEISKDHRWQRIDLNQSSYIAELISPNKSKKDLKNKWVQGMEAGDDET